MPERYSSEILAIVKAQEWDSPPTQGTIRLAIFGGMYDDPDNLSGDQIFYDGKIKTDLIFKKQIGTEFWREKSGIEFGYLDIALEDQDLELIDFGANVTVATVDFYRVNLDSPDQAQLEILATARTSDIGFNNENTLRLRMESVLADQFETPINELYYGYEYPQLSGKPYPMAWGLISDPQQIWPTTLVDAVSLLYHVTDLEISSFETAIYDRGVQLLEPASFTPTTHGFTLNQNPDGRITSGRILCVDPEDTGNYLHGLFRFVRLAATRAQLWSYVNQAELLQLETDIGFGELYPQWYSDRVVSFEQFLDFILQGVTGWYYVDELSEIHVGRLVPPEDQSAPIYNFTDSDVIGRIKVEDDKAPGLTSRISYANSPGAYDINELAGSVTGDDYSDLSNSEYVTQALNSTVVTGWTADDSTWKADNTVHTADGFASSENVTFITGYWRKSETRTPIYIPIAFDLGSPSAFDLAQGEVDRWWNELYDVRRRFYTFTVKLNNDSFNAILPQLGSFCTLQSDRFKLLTVPKALMMRRMELNFG